MAFQSDWGQVHNVPIRPLTKGMIKNLPSNALPPGAFREIMNFRAMDIGLTKRGGIAPFHTLDYTPDATHIFENEYEEIDDKLLDVIFYWKPAGDPEALTVSGGQLWELLANNASLHRDLTSSIPAGNITSYVDSGDGQNFVVTTDLTDRGLWRTGDYATDATTGYKSKVTEVRIVATFLTLYIDMGLVVTPSGTLTGTHMFKTNETFGVDHTVNPGYDNRIIFTDSAGRGIYTYNGTTLSIMTIDNGEVTDPILESAKVCTTFEDRLWVANTLEDSGTKQYVQRIRWSQPANFDYFRDVDYLDLPYSDGEILKIVPMGSILVIYCEDAIYFGRKTNIRFEPYKVTRLETGGMGPVSQRAIQPWIDGHFFVGHDDVYWFNASTSMQAITDPILKDTLTVSKNLNLLKYVEIASDPLNDSLVFLFPDVPSDQAGMKGLATKLWYLNTKSKGWSYYSVPYIGLTPAFYWSTVTASRFYTVDKTWQSWIDQEDIDSEEVDWIDEDATYVEQWLDKNTWFDLGESTYLDKTLFLGVYYRRATDITSTTQWRQGIYYEAGLPVDTITTGRTYNVPTLLESADYDFGAPETVKTVTRTSLKTYEQALERLLFSVEVSDDRALNWKQLPQLRWNPRYDEGRTNFRSTGSNFRFRISSDQETHPYTLTEMVLRVAGRGLQVGI